jgi:hypothetical protein
MVLAVAFNLSLRSSCLPWSQWPWAWWSPAGADGLQTGRAARQLLCGVSLAQQVVTLVPVPGDGSNGTDQETGRAHEKGAEEGDRRAGKQAVQRPGVSRPLGEAVADSREGYRPRGPRPTRRSVGRTASAPSRGARKWRRTEGRPSLSTGPHGRLRALDGAGVCRWRCAVVGVGHVRLPGTLPWHRRPCSSVVVGRGGE